MQKRVLIADNNPDLLDLCRIGFRNAPYRVDYAVDGDEVIERYRAAQIEERPYNLLVLDAAMPKSSGFYAAEKIRQRFNDPHTPIVFFTAYHDEIAEPRAKQAGVLDIWYKPLSIEDLKLRICLILNL